MDTDKKVLLVDDHDLVRFGTSVLLESLDEVHCDITPCRSLDEARTACRERGPFDLVLLDLNLPDAKGLQGLRTLREQCPNVPFAMLTGTQDEFVVRQAQAMGAVGYLLKSWTPERLRQALKSLLRPPQAATPAATISERFPKLAGSSHYDRVAELGPRHRAHPRGLQQSGNQQGDRVVARHREELRVGDSAGARCGLAVAPDQPVPLSAAPLSAAYVRGLGSKR